MLKNLDKYRLNIGVGTVVFLTTLFSYLYMNNAFCVSTMCITLGFVVAFYYNFGKKIIPGLFIGIVLANIIARLTLTTETFFVAVSFSVVFSSVHLFQAILFKLIMDGLEDFTKVVYRKVIIYILTVFAVSLIGSILSTSFMILMLDCCEFLPTLSDWILSEFSGILIFTTVILFSYSYDEEHTLNTKIIVTSSIYILTFSLFSYLVFSESISWLTYYDYSFLFILLFFIVSFFFSYRMITTINFIYVVFYQVFYLNRVDLDSIGPVALSFNVFILVLSTIAIVTKMVIYNLSISNEQLKISKTRLEDLIFSTNSLLKLSDDLLEPDIKPDEEYLKTMFSIATSIFDNFDSASCYLRDGDHIKYLSGIGYDINVLNSLNFPPEDFQWDINNPLYIKDVDAKVAAQLKDHYVTYNALYPKIKESLRIAISLEREVVGAMSFDIHETSGKIFNPLNFDTYKAFQKLMNSFYNINSLNHKNNSLKNDIVLSLIRTLELYDQYTGGHSEEVAYLAGQIASRMNLGEEVVYDVFWAGIVHDIGKVGIKSDIINKPEKLSLEEYEQIKDHPNFGYQILIKSHDLKHIAKIVKHHHEWWNGTGYPDSLKGEKIPLGSQILGVCDAVSSMATNRPYTLVKSSNEIIKELELYRSVQFAPDACDAMIEYIKDGSLDSFYKDR